MVIGTKHKGDNAPKSSVVFSKKNMCHSTGYRTTSHEKLTAVLFRESSLTRFYTSTNHIVTSCSRLNPRFLNFGSKLAVNHHKNRSLPLDQEAFFRA